MVWTLTGQMSCEGITGARGSIWPCWQVIMRIYNAAQHKAHLQNCMAEPDKALAVLGRPPSSLQPHSGGMLPLEALASLMAPDMCLRSALLQISHEALLTAVSSGNIQSDHILVWRTTIARNQNTARQHAHVCTAIQQLTCFACLHKNGSPLHSPVCLLVDMTSPCCLCCDCSEPQALES